MLWIKVGFFAGLLIAMPFILYQVWLFVAPGLYSHEKRFAIPFVLFASIFFFGGAMFSHYIAFPVTWGFFITFNPSFVQFMPKIGPAFALYVKMVLACGAVFQMPVLVFALARMGVVTAGFLLRNFKYAVLIIAILGAVLSPGGDIASQMILSGPMLVLYIISIGVAWVFQKRKPAAERRELGPDGVACTRRPRPAAGPGPGRRSSRSGDRPSDHPRQPRRPPARRRLRVARRPRSADRGPARARSDRRRTGAARRAGRGRRRRRRRGRRHRGAPRAADQADPRRGRAGARSAARHRPRRRAATGGCARRRAKRSTARRRTSAMPCVRWGHRRIRSRRCGRTRWPVTFPTMPRQLREAISARAADAPLADLRRLIEAIAERERAQTKPPASQRLDRRRAARSIRPWRCAAAGSRSTTCAKRSNEPAGRCRRRFSRR